MWRIFSDRAGLLKGVSVIECVLAFSVTLNIVQGRQLAIARDLPDERAIVGSRVAPLRGFDTQGAPMTVRYDSGNRPTILYYFNPECGWCKKNEVSVAALRRQTADRYRFIAVTATAAESVAERDALAELSPMWRANADQLRAYRLSGTPHTLVVSTDGLVLQSWPGAYRGRLHAELERYFHVDLPVAPAIR